MKKLLIIIFTAGILYNVANAQYGNILNFDNANGSYPYSTLLLLGNKFYACAQAGGVYTYGNIFSIDEDGKNDKIFYNFPSPGYPQIKNELLYVGHKLYGMANGVEANGYGNIFCIDSSGANYKDIWDFGFPGSPNGCNPGPCSLISVNGRLYGMTFWGGANGVGNIFRIDTDGTHYKDLYDFSTVDGASPEGILILLNKDQLYGTTSLGGTHSEGNVFSIDTAGNNFQDRFDFDYSDGYAPLGSLIALGPRIYGMTSGGSSVYDGGNIFSLDTNAHNNSFIDLWDFDAGGVDTNGDSPNADLTYSGKSFYGTTVLGGKNGIGNIFRIDTDGAHYTNMWNCSSVNGYFPYGNITISKGVMYGTMSGGGTYNKGVIFADTLISLRVTDTGVTCNGGNNGHATVYVSEGTPQFNYSWTGGSTMDKATGLSAGTFTVTVTDANGLVATATVIITQPAAAVSITIASNTNEACYGDQTSSATANDAMGGVSPYTYNWSPGGGTNLTASNMAAGTYTITATDSYGCTATASVSITQPPVALSITMASNTNEACYGDQAATAIANAATGGTLPYTYNWSPGGGTDLTVSNLSAGAYTITVTDNHGCMDTASISITQPAAALFVSMLSSTNVACYGDQTATAIANAAIGGTLPYTYNWSPGGGTSLTASNLSVGTYTITAMDNHGCTALASVSITQPIASLGGTTYSTPDTGSNSGSAAINPIGGTGPYTYHWSPGGETTDSITHLSPGVYTVTVTDNNGCTYSTLAKVDNTTGITGINSGQSTQISVYPNPSGGTFIFWTNNYLPLANSCIGIYNILGEQVYLKLLIVNSQFSINLSNEPNGLYMYRITSGAGDLLGQGKLIIQR